VNPVERRRPRSVVLVGFMGAGKSTVGPLLARRLGWRFTDIDEEIVRRTGASVAEIFRSRGESAFRAMERELTAALSSGPDTVIAPGGGWILQPGALESLPGTARVVWLRVSPEEAVRRLRNDPIERPLLAGPDPLGQARALLPLREPAYRRAHYTVDADARAPADIAAEIAALLDLEGHGDEDQR
jgi:shikimate kinase